MQMHATPARRLIPITPGRSRADQLPPSVRSESQEDTHLHQARYSPDQLCILTLGQFRVRLPEESGEALKWGSPQSKLLLKCLVAAPGQQLTHDELIEMLWPESAPEHGRRRLRDALSSLRRALEPAGPAYGRSAFVHSDRESLRLKVEGQKGGVVSVWLDVSAFEQLAEAAMVGPEAGVGARRGMAEAALALYRGPFLPLDRYVEWTQTPRQRYHRLWSMLVRRVVYAEIADRNLERAIYLLGALTDDTPDDEDAIYLSMVVHTAAGRRAEALRIYQQLRMHLLASLGSVPKPELQAIGETIRSGAPLDDVMAALK